MEALLGFHVGFWDYVTFGAMAVIVMAFLALAVFILGLPGRIAIARKHPEADASISWVGSASWPSCPGSRPRSGPSSRPT
jgi:hypothetical protein